MELLQICVAVRRGRIVLTTSYDNISVGLGSESTARLGYHALIVFCGSALDEEVASRSKES
jgi:hypothetical protein